MLDFKSSLICRSYNIKDGRVRPDRKVKSFIAVINKGLKSLLCLIKTQNSGSVFTVTFIDVCTVFLFLLHAINFKNGIVNG